MKTVDINYNYVEDARKKKYMATLISILTDYVSNNVRVEKILGRLDIIVDQMNKDKIFINRIFNEMNIDTVHNECKIQIVFKGGNVYKLFTAINKSNLQNIIYSS